MERELAGGELDSHPQFAVDLSNLRDGVIDKKFPVLVYICWADVTLPALQRLSNQMTVGIDICGPFFATRSDSVNLIREID